jgi:hypothetical protein
VINKRLLIRNLLAYHGENSFYDNKETLDLHSRPSKAKFLKHICALANANPQNKAFIVVGIDDRTNDLKGVDFFDDARLQNLIDAYIDNAPQVQYENVPFPELQRHKVIGLVSVQSIGKVAKLKKSIWNYNSGNIFLRIGSTSRWVDALVLEDFNSKTVHEIEKQSRNNIELTLKGVFDFLNRHKDVSEAQYLVFNEQFVLCWAGQKKVVGDKVFYSRVDIELVNEQVRLFYSYMDEVKIEISKKAFITSEYVPLYINGKYEYFPLEKSVIHFKETGVYNLATELLFQPPEIEQKTLVEMNKKSRQLLEKLQNNTSLNTSENEYVMYLADSFLLLHLNAYPDAIQCLSALKELLKNRADKKAYIKYKEVLRVLRKINSITIVGQII